MLMILVRWILRKTLNRHLQYHLGAQHDLFIFGALPPIQHFSDDICPSVMQNELLRRMDPRQIRLGCARWPPGSNFIFSTICNCALSTVLSTICIRGTSTCLVIWLIFSWMMWLSASTVSTTCWMWMFTPCRVFPRVWMSGTSTTFSAREMAGISIVSSSISGTGSSTIRSTFRCWILPREAVFGASTNCSAISGTGASRICPVVLSKIRLWLKIWDTSIACSTIRGTRTVHDSFTNLLRNPFFDRTVRQLLAQPTCTLRYHVG